jgi:hypothetical protein
MGTVDLLLAPINLRTGFRKIMNESDRIRFMRAKTLARNPAARGNQYDGEEHTAVIVGRQPVFFQNKLVVPCCGQSITPEGNVVYFTVTYTPSVRSTRAIPGINVSVSVTGQGFEPIDILLVETSQGGVITVELVGRSGGKALDLTIAGTSVDYNVSIAPSAGAITVENARVDVETLTVNSIDIELDTLYQIVIGSTDTTTSLTAGSLARSITATSTNVLTTGSTLDEINMTGGNLTTTQEITVESLVLNGATNSGDVVLQVPPPRFPPSVYVTGEEVTISGEPALLGQQITMENASNSPALSTGWRVAYYADPTATVTVSSALIDISSTSSALIYVPSGNIASYFACLYRDPSNNTPGMGPATTEPVLFAKAPTCTKTGGPLPFTPVSIDISAGVLPAGYDIVRYYTSALDTNYTETANPLVISAPVVGGAIRVAVRLRKISNPSILSDLSNYTVVTL